MSHSSLRLTQNRRIYDQIGMTLWADRQSITRFLSDDKTAVISFAQALDRSDMVAKELGAETSKQMIDLSLQIKPINTPIVTDQTSANLHAKSAKQTQPGMVESTKSTLQFELQALSYRTSIILAAVSLLEPPVLSVWQSLVAALMQADPSTAMHKLNYPTMTHGDDDPMLLMSSVMGFFYGIRRQNPTAAKLLIMTPLPSGVNLSADLGINQMNHNFSLVRMVDDQAHKKQFWQLIHSPSDA